LLPFIKIGPLHLPTFGLLMWVAFIVAYFVLRADFRRRRVNAPADNVVLLTAFGGIVGAKLYHVLERPTDLLADPFHEIFSTAGFAWFGGLIAGIATLFWLARHYRISWLSFFDAVAPAAALGYAVGRIGCLISGDGDYGVPTSLPWGMSFPNGLVPTPPVCEQFGWPSNCAVHPTPIYEFLVGVGIFYYLWWLGRRQLRVPRPAGEVLGEYLLWTGLARFLVEFIRINPRSFFGVLSNAQAASVLSMLAGGALLIVIKRRFKSMKQEHKIIRHLETQGNPGVQREYHKPTPECPNPERWHMFDSMTAEVEVLEFLKCLVTTMKPQLVVETGTFLGISTLWIAEGLKQNGFGKVITCENDPAIFKKAKERFDGSGLGQWIECRNESSLVTKIKGTIDLLFSDSAFEIREQEVCHFLPQLNPHGAIVMHDASSHLKTVREAALKLEAAGLISVVLMPTPRGLVLAQKRQGRK
jgi:prolipoprotein diacylglyceryl transferase